MLNDLFQKEDFKARSSFNFRKEKNSVLLARPTLHNQIFTNFAFDERAEDKSSRSRSPNPTSPNFIKLN